ncbi:MAG: hypothetical protein ACP5F0_03550 [Sulfurihydrogenibium sp.]
MYFRLNKIFNLLIGLYLLFANSITLVHHHEDNQPHPDCQVCVLQLNQQSEDPLDLTFVFELPEYKEDYQEIYTSFFFKKSIPFNLLPRSPPLF